jgi:two-component system cell cycle response regulator
MKRAFCPPWGVVNRCGPADEVAVSAPDTTARPRWERALRVGLAAVLFGATGLIVLHDWLGLGGPSLDFLAGGPLYDLVVVAAGIAFLARARTAARERAGWLLLGLAILSWAAGEIYWTWFILDSPEPPYPSPADAFYLGFYPLAYAGLAFLVRARAHELDWRRWTDGAIAALGTAALGTAFVFDFVADHTEGTGLEVTTSLAYPLGDIAMLSMIVGVIALTGWRPGRTWSLLLAGLAAQVVADIAYTLQSTEGVVPAGNWIDPIYLISAAILGSILWLPDAAEIQSSEQSDGTRELVLPALFATVMTGLFAMQYFSAASGLASGLWAATMVAVILRLAISVRENRRLLEQVQTDPLTGLRNRGRLQIDLERVCAAASERPAYLVFLDLNGFKKLNDTLGHPAGDELLVRIGERLLAAVRGRGSAYRTGGDEFCVLLTCSSSEFEPAMRRAVDALTERGAGYRVSASWGTAAIPDETDTPSAALQLADVRMYAHKERHRAGEGVVLPAVDDPPELVTRGQR